MSWSRAVPVFFSAMLAVVAGSCSGDKPTDLTEPRPVNRVMITPDDASVIIGQTQVLSATVLDATGSEITGHTIRWSSSNRTAATVDVNGIVTALRAGALTIAASVDGVSGTARIQVREPAPARVTAFPDSAALFVGESQKFSSRAFDAAGVELTGRTVQWSSSDPGVVTITRAGIATAKGPGSATITAAVDGATATAPIRVRESPVKSTSYDNFKRVGLQPAAFPLPLDDNWYYTDIVARTYGDFYGRGQLDVFTARLTYDWRRPVEMATRATYSFWRRDGESFVVDNSILVQPGNPCLHPRKAIVADFNLDRRPDVFLACHGYNRSPFPGERAQVLLSQPDGRYVVREAASEVGFWHGASAADLNGDGYPDVVAVAGGHRVVLLNRGDGTFVREAANRLPDFAGRLFFTVELVDVNEDGRLDLLMGGHEWEGYGEYKTTPTSIWLNPGNNDFSTVTPVVIPAVADEGIVVDFAVTGAGPTRTIWVSRTSGEASRFYQTAVLQRFHWSTRTSSVEVRRWPAAWVPWIVPYTRGGTLYIGSDDLRTPLEHAIP